MDYATAKEIVKEYAEELLIDPERKTHAHICVRRTLKSAPFSIMLPNVALNESPEEGVDPVVERDAAERKILTDALRAAREVL
jgi:hypothetical protein